MNMKRIASIFSIACVLLSPFGAASQGAQADESYRLRLAYEPIAKTLAPRSEAPFSVVSVPFSPELSPNVADYLAVVVSGKGSTLARVGFNRPARMASGKLVAIEPLVPYFPNAAKIDVYEGAALLFSLDVSSASICAENGKCEYEFGESAKNCPADCENAPPAFLPPPASPLPGTIRPPLSASSDGIVAPTAPKAGELFAEDGGMSGRTALAVAFFVLGLATFSVWIYLRRKSG